MITAIGILSKCCVFVVFWSCSKGPSVAGYSSVAAASFQRQSEGPIVKQHSQDRHPSSNDGNFVPGYFVSESCWLDAAIRTLHLEDINGAPTDMCQFMTSRHQKIMALELARCHVQDLGRTLFQESTDTVGSCHTQDLDSQLSECLKCLSPTGETAYTHFLTYINQLCIRLSREVVMDQFYQSSMQLAKSSAHVQSQIQEMIQQQEWSSQLWRIQQQEALESHQRFQSQVNQDRLQHRQESIQMQNEWKVEQDSWRREQHDVQRRQLEEMMEQQQGMKRQKEELAILVETIARANRSMLPWSLNVQSIYQCAHRFLLVALAWANYTKSAILLWLLTWPYCLQWIRSYLITWLILGAALESAILVLLFSNEEDDEARQSNDILRSDIRIFIELSTITLYVAGALISPCWRQKIEFSPSAFAADDILKHHRPSVLASRSASPPRLSQCQNAHFYSSAPGFIALPQHCNRTPAGTTNDNISEFFSPIQKDRFEDERKQHRWAMERDAAVQAPEHVTPSATQQHVPITPDRKPPASATAAVCRESFPGQPSWNMGEERNNALLPKDGLIPVQSCNDTRGGAGTMVGYKRKHPEPEEDSSIRPELVSQPNHKRVRCSDTSSSSSASTLEGGSKYNP